MSFSRRHFPEDRRARKDRAFSLLPARLTRHRILCIPGRAFRAGFHRAQSLAKGQGLGLLAMDDEDLPEIPGERLDVLGGFELGPGADD